MVNHMIDLHKILRKKNIKMSLAVYPWPHQLSYDVVNSVRKMINYNLVSQYESSREIQLQLENQFE